MAMDSADRIGLSRREIFNLVRSKLNDNVTAVYEEIDNLMSSQLGYSFTLPESVKPVIRKLMNSFRKKWRQVKRTEKFFFEKFENWLAVFVPFKELKLVVKTPNKPRTGRPLSDFNRSSERTKRRKTENVRANTCVEELCYATQMSLRESGNLNAANIVHDISTGGPSSSNMYRKSSSLVPETILSADSALSLMIEQKLSRNQYQGLRNISLENNCRLYPSYKVVQQAKIKCYPLKLEMTITESIAEVKLQSLLNHTTERIMLMQTEVIKNLTSENFCKFTLICKWGCDGTSGQNMFKQTFSNDDGTKSDSNIFFTSLVPVQLLSVENDTEIVVWKNPRPSSPRFCRPIRIQFLHENTKDTVIETDYIKDQESKLVSFKTTIGEKEIVVDYKLALTMIDGKVCNAITGNSSTQRCYLCQATSKQFNDIDTILKLKVNEDHLQFGMSTLHAWIRFFECCLHVAYKIDIKKWHAHTPEEKKQTETVKKSIQMKFRLQLGLLVDKPKPGFGSTNDGNTARRFFENAAISAAITGLNEDLIKQFHIILQVISCGHEINLINFQAYCLETARKFVELYPWFYMPTSVHKILIHGKEIVASSLLPMGQMSEDAQESCNKLIKRYREDFSRKCNRTKTMEDVFLRLLITSDPYISGLRKLPQRQLKSLSPEAILLLLPATSPQRFKNTPSEESTDYDTDGDDSGN